MPAPAVTVSQFVRSAADAVGMKSSAAAKRDRYVLNGAKRYEIAAGTSAIRRMLIRPELFAESA